MSLGEPASSFVSGGAKNHQLVILGNGFDLACGLRSSFSEFFSPRVAEIKTIDPKDDKKWVAGVVARGYTAWDLILSSLKELAGDGSEVVWCNVEAAIAEVVQTSGDSDKTAANRLNVSAVAKYFRFIAAYDVKMRPTEFVERFRHRLSVPSELDRLERDFSKRIEGEEVEDWAVKAFGPFIDEQLSYEYGCLPSDLYTYGELVENACPNKEGEKLGVFLRFRYPSILRWDVSSIRGALMSELHLLEGAFNRYLSQEFSLNLRYPSAASSLLSEICRYSKDADDPKTPTDITLLNFNYTNPLTVGLAGDLAAVNLKQINVHGRLGHELIFGIDGSRCLSDSGQLRFSKTFRLLQLQAPSIEGPIAYPTANADADDVNTVAIKFYGHSLSRADYSYFQSIFDMVDLYAGSVKLYFFYKPFKLDALDELLVNVANLLNEYGKSMDNQSHGRNLMHKLLLERRLIVKEISS